MKWYHLEGMRFGALTVLRSGKSTPAKSGTRKFWVCRCDCGKEKQIISASLVSGKTKSCGCLRGEAAKKRVRELHQNWKGGRHVNTGGYSMILMPEHINSRKSGYVAEHIFVMSEKIGRPIRKDEIVHHLNGIKTDNRIENLELWTKSHPEGQRVVDILAWCVEFLDRYAKKQTEALYPIKIEEV